MGTLINADNADFKNLCFSALISVPFLEQLSATHTATVPERVLVAKSA
jgi:hypothetical protein